MGSTHRPVIQAFLHKKDKKITNTESRNGALFLFENKIAWWQGEDLYISDCGWCSQTTQDRFNMLPGVWIKRTKGDWYISPTGMPVMDIKQYKIWNGSPLKIK